MAKGGGALPLVSITGPESLVLWSCTPDLSMQATCDNLLTHTRDGGYEVVCLQCFTL